MIAFGAFIMGAGAMALVVVAAIARREMADGRVIRTYRNLPPSGLEIPMPECKPPAASRQEGASQ